MLGWLGPLVLNFGWYSNPFFIFCIGRLLLSSNSSRVAPVLASLLALETFRYDGILLNEGGSTVPIFGYGYGAIVWLSSICIMVVASGTRLAERSSDPDANFPWSGEDQRKLGLGMTGVLVLLSVVLGLYDRINANENELRRFAGVAFKKGPVCASKDAVTRRVALDDGPIEIVRGEATNLPYNLSYPEYMLGWGVPEIRMNGLDYSIVDLGVAPAVSARLANGESRGRLEAQEKRVGDSESFNGFIRLKLVDSGGTVFDRIWKREHNNVFCPDFQSSPRADEDPRKSILLALGIAGPGSSASFEGHRGILRNESPREIPRVGVVADTGSSASFVGVNDIGCAPDVGFRKDLFSSHPETLWLGKPFQIGSQMYFSRFDHTESPHAICLGSKAYVFGITFMQYPELGMFVQKWSLPEKKIEWIYRFIVHDSNGQMPAGRLFARSVTEFGNELRLLLTDESGSKAVRANILMKAQ